MDAQLQELLDWAFDASAGEPVQDWDLWVAASPFCETCVQLAADPECPKSGFFLAVLYLIVGDAVRTSYRAHTRQQVEALLRAAGRFPVLKLWVERSGGLMERPETFDYEDWCGGKLARSC
jgi:hypothetical protein